MRERHKIHEEPHNAKRDTNYHRESEEVRAQRAAMAKLRVEKRNATIDRQNAIQYANRLNHKKALLRNLKRDVAALTERYNREFEAYKQQILEHEDMVKLYEDLVAKAHATIGENQKQCAACEEFYPIKGGTYTKHIKKCKGTKKPKEPEPEKEEEDEV